MLYLALVEFGSVDLDQDPKVGLRSVNAASLQDAYAEIKRVLGPEIDQGKRQYLILNVEFIAPEYKYVCLARNQFGHLVSLVLPELKHLDPKELENVAQYTCQQNNLRKDSSPVLDLRSMDLLLNPSIGIFKVPGGR